MKTKLEYVPRRTWCFYGEGKTVGLVLWVGFARALRQVYAPNIATHYTETRCVRRKGVEYMSASVSKKPTLLKVVILGNSG